MIFWLAKSVVLSLLLIIIINYLYIFLKNNLTQPKIKDLIHHPKKEYEDILEIINKGNNISNIKDTESTTTKISDLPDNPSEESYLDNNNMQNELSQFLLEQNDNMITTHNEGNIIISLLA